MKKFLVALQFLTIIPVKKVSIANETDVVRSSSFFVIVGLVQGILLLLTDYIAGRVFHPDLVTGIILFMLVLSSGGFHLDGLADTFDALAAKGDRDKKLSVMRDGSTGPAGVISIVFSLSLKYLALNNLTHFLPFTYFSSLLTMPVFSKWAMIVAIFHGKPAREDGLGNIFIKKTGLKEFGFSTFWLILLLTLILLFFGQYAPENQCFFYAFLLLALYIFCLMAVQFFNKRFEGLTGDTLGAISELSEIMFLFIVIIWSRLHI